MSLQKGIAPIAIIFVIAAIAVLGVGSYVFVNDSSEKDELIDVLKIEKKSPLPSTKETISLPRLSKKIDKKVSPPSTQKILKRETPPLVFSPPPVESPPPSIQPSPPLQKQKPPPLQEKGISWYSDKDGWKVKGTPPSCGEPLGLRTPVDMSKASGALYPGQRRGPGQGGYKPHGGVRFDKVGNNIKVVAPMDAELWRGARYLVGGEIQYTLDFIAPCGIWLRFGHLRILSPKLDAIAKTFREPQEGDSRSNNVPPGTFIKIGEEIATTVGLIGTNNAFVDFGVFDLRKKNKASKDPYWAQAHTVEQDHYAICWIDWLVESDAKTFYSLPAGNEGKVSDFCKN